MAMVGRLIGGRGGYQSINSYNNSQEVDEISNRKSLNEDCEHAALHVDSKSSETKNHASSRLSSIEIECAEQQVHILKSNTTLFTRKNIGWAGVFVSAMMFVLTLVSIGYQENRNRMRSILLKTQPFKVVSHSEAPTSLWGAVTKPYPTGAFWTNLVVRQGDGPVALHPYGIKCLDTGIHVSYGPTRRTVTQVSVLDTFATDLQIGSLETYTSRSLERYDNSSVTMAFTASTGKYRAYMVKGSPFVTVAFENTTPVIQSPVMKISAVDARVRNNVAGVQYIVSLGNFQKWLVYCSEPVVLVWKDNALSSPLPIRGVIRVAVLPQLNSEAAFTTLMNYVSKYPTGVQTALSYSTGATAVDRTATMTMTFITQGSGPLLMYVLPHHARALASGGQLETEESKLAQSTLTSIYSMKGKLRAIVADSWRLTYALPSVSWNYALAEKLGTQQMDQIAYQLMQDVKVGQPSSSDPYGFGKEIGRAARLALIADYLGIPEARTQAISTLESSFLPWVTGSNPNALVYDRIWGGIISSAGLADSQADYGSGWYSDHHFHYGYFIYGAAVLARLDTPFFDTYKGAFDALVRDVCNPDPSDADFPVARHKDFFDGHSWASGLFQQSNGKGQESSSEAVNAYYACHLYALATANKDLQWFSHFLLASEVQAAVLYWHMPNEDVYDAPFTASRMVGNIGAFDATTTTWFGSELEYVHGINMMPVTPATALLFDQPFAALQYPLLASRLPPPVTPEKQQCSSNAQCVSLGMATGACCPTADGVMLACCDPDSSGSRMQEEWKTLIYIDHAITDREASRQQILSAGGFGSGNSKCNALFWAASRPAAQSTYDLIPHAPEYAKSIKPSCAANSACDSAG